MMAFSFSFHLGFSKLEEYFYQHVQRNSKIPAYGSKQISHETVISLWKLQMALSFMLWQNENSTFETSLFPILFPTAHKVTASNTHSRSTFQPEKSPVLKVKQRGEQNTQNNVMIKIREHQLILRSRLLNPFMSSLSRFLGNTVLGSPLPEGCG